MPELQRIRFQKYDQYNNPIFIASSSNESEMENYEKLKNAAEKLESKFEGFMPIYNNELYNYSTIRFGKSAKYNRLSPNALYNIDYKIVKVEKEGKTYVNCYINRIRLVEKAKIKEQAGVEIEL